MFLYLSKIIPVFTYPVGIAGLLLFASICLMLSKKRNLAVFTGILSLTVLYVFSCPVFEHVLVRHLESKYDQPATFPHASAIVVLGGSTVPPVPPRHYVELNEAGDRLINGARLYKKGYAPYIICTGGRIPFLTAFSGTEAQSMADFYKEHFGFDSTSVLLEDKAQNTHDHVANVKKILAAKNLSDTIILVTSAMHMDRSVRLFRKAGYTVYPAPTDYLADAEFKMSIFGLLPSADALYFSTVALHEYYGLFAYKKLGWI